MQSSRVSWHWWKIRRGIDLSFQNWLAKLVKYWHSKVSQICTLMKLIEFSLCTFFHKVYNAWAEKVQRSYLSWHSRVMRNLKKNWVVVWKVTWGIWQILTGWKKDFILESKMTELNQNKNSKQPDWPDAVSKLYFTLEINEYQN